MKSFFCCLFILATLASYAQRQDSLPHIAIPVIQPKTASPKKAGYFIYLHTKDKKVVPLTDSVSKAFFEKTEIDSFSVENDKKEKITIIGLSFLYFPIQGDIMHVNIDNPPAELIPAFRNTLLKSKPYDKIILDNVSIVKEGMRMKLDAMVLKIVP